MSLQIEVKISVILHATEDSEKIFRMFFENFGLSREVFKIENLTGHFNNPITIVEIILKKKNSKEFLKKFFEKMKKDDFDEIYENVENKISNSSLQIKISKQKMIQGEIVLHDTNAIKINISCPVYIKRDTKKIYQEVLQLTNNSK